MLYALRVAEGQLRELVDVDQTSPLERRIGRVRARAEYCDIADVVETGLDQFLKSLQEDIYGVAAAVDRRFFRAGTDLDLHAYQSV